jgi:integrase
VNSWISGLPLSATTRHNIRRELLTLWRYAYDRGLTQEPPLRIRRIQPCRKPPQAWTLDTLRRMLTLAEKDESPISSRVKLRRCDVLPAWIGVGYDTGIRFSDVIALTSENVRNGCIAIVAHKTGKPLVRRLSPSTITAVERLLSLSPDGTLFAWSLPRRRALLMWREFLKQHKLAGSSKWLRRSCATQVHMAEKGAAVEYLQHSSPMLSHYHYIDASQAGVPNPPPPIREVVSVSG